MITKANNLMSHIRSIFLLALLVIVLSLLTACGPSTAELETVDYTPLPGAVWEISTPEKEGLDADRVAELYLDAAQLDTIYGLLIIKNDRLVAEKYFNAGSVALKSNMQSVTKSFVSALVGLALEQGCLTSLDQPFLDFFPEYADRIEDTRKRDITIRHLLQMRSGYPWEESHPDLWEGMMTGDLLSMMVYYPLVSDPGTQFHYSNVSSHYLVAIVERACGMDVRTFAEEQLFTPIGAEMGEWWHTEFDDGYPMGASGLHVNLRDAAKLGQLYLHDGVYDGEQVIPAEWVHDSLQVYSDNAWTISIGRNMQDFGYGYQWWTGRSGKHVYNFAWGHGGQIIAVLDEFDMVIALMADPMFLQHNDDAWRHEKNNLNLVGDFIASLPEE